MTTRKPPADVERRMLSFALAAAYLGVSLRAMKGELGGPQGEIPRVVIAGRVLFDRQDLDAYIEKAKRSA